MWRLEDQDETSEERLVEIYRNINAALEAVVFIAESEADARLHDGRDREVPGLKGQLEDIMTLARAELYQIESTVSCPATELASDDDLTDDFEQGSVTDQECRPVTPVNRAHTKRGLSIPELPRTKWRAERPRLGVPAQDDHFRR